MFYDASLFDNFDNKDEIFKDYNIYDKRRRGELERYT